MTYSEAADYILELPKFTTKNKPEHTKEFLARLGNPQSEFKVIHVAGTNGKGSVCTYLNAMLLAQKEKVGLFVSPHLVKMNERIKINGEDIQDEEFLNVFNIVLETVRKMADEGLPHPTFFEFLFGMAVVAFHRAGVSYAVLETGLGGRLDATNQVEKPAAVIITSIGYDHMAILGDTIEKIAFEKAGIIKEGVPVFFADSCFESNDVIEEQAEKMLAPFKKIEKDDYKILGIENKHIAFSPVSAYYEDKVWRLNNIGVYQPENAMLALEVMRYLFRNKGEKELWREVLADVKWEGRMDEVVPGVYVDGAHNISAVIGFADTVNQLNKPNIILFSAVSDKEYDKMIAHLCENVETDFYVITRIEDDRAAELDLLQGTFRRFTDKPVYVIEDLNNAIEFVMEEKKDRNVYCLGSLYLAGMIKRRSHDAELRRRTEEV